MLDTLEYTSVSGQKSAPSITLYSLSTCGFCKRAMAFLEANGFAYRYVHMDKLPLDTKNEAKRILKERYQADVAFPFATLGENEHLVGFIEADWKRTLGI
ncbi:MAG TPA: glutaredoxin family protein [Spirochaetales bacterium]|nr:glutaredoxin family protein [Spirochaetales bacterium]